MKQLIFENLPVFQFWCDKEVRQQEFEDINLYIEEGWYGCWFFQL